VHFDITIFNKIHPNGINLCFFTHNFSVEEHFWDYKIKESVAEGKHFFAEGSGIFQLLNTTRGVMREEAARRAENEEVKLYVPLKLSVLVPTKGS